MSHFFGTHSQNGKRLLFSDPDSRLLTMCFRNTCTLVLGITAWNLGPSTNVVPVCVPDSGSG